MQLLHKVALVTGGADGIGKAICQRFKAEGGKVVIADVADDKGAALAKEIGGDDLRTAPQISGVLARPCSLFRRISRVLRPPGSTVSIPGDRKAQQYFAKAHPRTTIVRHETFRGSFVSCLSIFTNLFWPLVREPVIPQGGQFKVIRTRSVDIS